MSKNCHDIEKVKRFQEVFYDEKIDEFYSDSRSDIYMAKLANIAFYINNNQVENW